MTELKLYNDYDEFKADTNRKNGCTQKWLDINEITLEDAQKLNWHNSGCFNCINCYACVDCVECANCYKCVNCVKCNGCIDCTDLNLSVNCIQTNDKTLVNNYVENKYVINNYVNVNKVITIN